jgi:hypothetical protein
MLADCSRSIVRPDREAPRPTRLPRLSRMANSGPRMALLQTLPRAVHAARWAIRQRLPLALRRDRPHVRARRDARSHPLSTSRAERCAGSENWGEANVSRSGYSDDIDQWELIRWRGQVASAIRGKRGQAFLRELIEALDALPEKCLVANELQDGADVCSLGSIGVKRGIDMNGMDPWDHDGLSRIFGIAEQLVQEIEYMNDEGAWRETPEERWTRMRKWATEQLRVQP